jgi:hypothetical protein
MPDQPPSTTEPPAHGPDHAELLAYGRGRITDPVQRQALRDRLAREPRLRAHWDSIRYLDLEEAAAVQDARDLRAFTQITRFCRAVASGQRNPLVTSDERIGTAQEWDRHFDRCVFCRRSQRVARAEVEATRLGEPLLRDRVLRPMYAEALEAAAERIRRAPTPTRVALILTDTGFVALAIAGTRTDLGPTTAPFAAVGWTVKRTEPPARRGAVMRSPEDSGKQYAVLDFQRALPDGRGTLEVRLQPTGTELAWVVRLSPAPGTPVALTVVGTETHTAESGDGKPIELLGNLSPDALRTGGGLRVRVVQGNELWGKFVFTPRSEP